MRATDLTIDTPKNYLTDVVGTEFPTEYVEDRRNITSNLNVYFKAADASKFATGFAGSEIPVEIVYGDTPGKKLSIYMPRVKLTVPSIQHESPTVSLQIPIKALGTLGEDSIYMTVV
jgi:hypothetical protein